MKYCRDLDEYVFSTCRNGDMSCILFWSSYHPIIIHSTIQTGYQNKRRKFRTCSSSWPKLKLASSNLLKPSHPFWMSHCNRPLDTINKTYATYLSGCQQGWKFSLMPWPRMVSLWRLSSILTDTCFSICSTWIEKKRLNHKWHKCYTAWDIMHVCQMITSLIDQYS